MVHRTTAGVTGVAAACERAEEVILGSFVMARAIAEYLRRTNPDRVTLVAMGERGKERSPEDEACADYLEHLLMGRPYDPVKVFEDIVFKGSAQKFIQGTRDYLPREDPLFCLQYDLFDFALRVRKVRDTLEVFKIPR